MSLSFLLFHASVAVCTGFQIFLVKLLPCRLCRIVFHSKLETLSSSFIKTWACLVSWDPQQLGCSPTGSQSSLVPRLHTCPSRSKEKQERKEIACLWEPLFSVALQQEAVCEPVLLITILYGFLTFLCHTCPSRK
jgi:hypothetical protein